MPFPRNCIGSCRSALYIVNNRSLCGLQPLLWPWVQLSVTQHFTYRWEHLANERDEQKPSKDGPLEELSVTFRNFTSHRHGRLPPNWSYFSLRLYFWAVGMWAFGSFPSHQGREIRVDCRHGLLPLASVFALTCFSVSSVCCWYYWEENSSAYDFQKKTSPLVSLHCLIIF